MLNSKPSLSSRTLEVLAVMGAVGTIGGLGLSTAIYLRLRDAEAALQRQSFKDNVIAAATEKFQRGSGAGTLNGPLKTAQGTVTIARVKIAGHELAPTICFDFRGSNGVEGSACIDPARAQSRTAQAELDLTP